MLVESLCPLRVSSMVWQTGDKAWALTVICKATYELRPGEARLAGEQEYPNDDENHWDDDPARSVHSPSDLVPIKARADVVLVGHAFAPRGEAVRALVARLAVGTIDKAIEARADGTPFAKMPLRYERAGGDAEENPVGVVGGTPNLARAGGVAGMAVGFGPIAAQWPARASKLGEEGTAWLRSPWHAAPMPADFDVGFFNAAPVDQRLDRIEIDERIILDNLSPIHPRLVTSLPGVRPRAFVIKAHAEIEEVVVHADTLWIDTDRSICTVTWRGQVPLRKPNEEGRVAVLMEEPGAPIGWSDVEAQLEPDGDEEENPRHGSTQEIRLADRASLSRPRKDALPFRAVAPPKTSTANDSEESLSRDDLMSHTVTELPDDVRIDATPAWLPSTRAGRSEPPPRSPIPPPPVSGAWATANMTPTEKSARAEWADALAQPAPPILPSPASVLGASNAAASARPWGNDKNEASRTPIALSLPSRALPSELVELLWFDPAALPKIREALAFQEPIASMQPKRPAVVYDDDPIPEESQEVKDRRDLFTAITVAIPLNAGEIDEAIEGAIGERGEFVPPLGLVTGELAFPFDEVEMLKATIAAAAPLAAGDRKLKEVVDVAIELVKGPVSPGAADGVTARIKEAFAQPGRMLPASYLDQHTERLLLEHRHYQRRTLLGQRYLRALLSHAGGASPIPTYLPESLANTLPLYLRFRARLVVEVHLAQDQYETHPLALRAVVLARVAPTQRARK